MGRNSADATNASLIRAARARLTALLACRLGLLDFLPAATRFAAVGAFFFAVAGAVVFAVIAVFGAVFFVAAVEAAPEGAAVDPPEDCPITGCKTMSTKRRPAREHAAWRKT
jgi:hypothetical protein